jgi:hypothetical protein
MLKSVTNACDGNDSSQRTEPGGQRTETDEQETESTRVPSRSGIFFQRRNRQSRIVLFHNGKIIELFSFAKYFCF